MNTKLCLFLSALALSLGLSAWCAAQEAQPKPEASAFLDALREDEEKQRLKVLADEGEKAVAVLRAELAGAWTSVVIAFEYDCSCMAPEYGGFCLKREGGKVTVEPWKETKGRAKTGEPRPIAQPEVEKLLAEAALYYQAATQSVSPSEQAGPAPGDAAKMKEWFERYLAAGGPREGGDTCSFEIRVVTPDGVRRHNDMWGNDIPIGFSKWIGAFGNLALQ